MRLGMTILICTAVLAAPVAEAAESNSVGRVVGQPFRDLSLIQDKLPEILKRSSKGPYDLSSAQNCTQVRQEIADLDMVLGPDIDELSQKKGMSPDSLAAELIGGVVKLPFRGILRRVSGAQAREEAIRAAILAGMVRRGFLKGRLSQLSCSAP